MSLLTTRDGTRLYFEDWGTGRPVILLGTAMLSAKMWEHQAPYLAKEGFRCITYDRRGSGRSDRPWQGYDYDSLADDLADLLDHLDLTDVALVGYAVGGGEAVQYLARYGEQRVSGLVLVASTTPFMMQTQDNPDGLDIALFDQLVEVMTADRPKWMSELAGTFFAGADPERAAVSAEFARWIIDIALDSSPRAAVEIYRTLITADQRTETAKVSVPTMIIHGDADLGAPWPLCGLKTSQLLPDASVHLYPGAAHGLFATHADRLNADLQAFLSAGAVLPGRASREDSTVAVQHR
ncbi:alpha/beta fold hydrolase [Jatrophihabitans lederbergiae]|uniref:Alpha/beta hydrolase n=1 Tax=Jatrophihabitans lederbergiae TaxID=3075547 RepID=A0ABU2JBL6_9ACTN|nr:alpha/beta hydrolase [Jatrophihabitans sp. DSM 44399]MDT0262123.1 alpha/beta hydrolase [Jatrophihabitans sp. DSM 44399]